MVLNNCSMWSPTQVTNGCLIIARACVLALGAQLRTLKVQILNFDRRIMAWHRSNEASRRLDEIPGVGPALATARVATALIRRLSIWTEFFGLDWARAEATLERGQGQARQHQQSDIG